ncbi:MAG: DUF2178 domain-containing protein [Candidatus Gracilibacteria bacterium]
MQYKKYRAIKIGIVMVLAATISSFVSNGNWIIPLIAFVIAGVIILLLNRKVDVKQTDERVEKIGGKAARYIFSFLMLGSAIASLVLTALAKDAQVYQIPAYIFSGIVWVGLVGYSVLFYFFNHKGEGKIASKNFAQNTISRRMI